MANTIFDIRLDNKSLYHSTAETWGTTKARAENPVAREPKVSVIKESKVNPYLTKRAFEQHLQAVPSGHDLLNRAPDAKAEFTSTTRTDYYKEPIPPQDFE